MAGQNFDEKLALADLLQQTSRSFYLTLRVLPQVIRPQIGLAYLIARTADTIADTELVPVAQRLEALRQLRERIQGASNEVLSFGGLVRQQEQPAEQLLLKRVEESVAALNRLPESDAKLVRQVLDTITSGQGLDLQRFQGATVQNIVSLQSAADLDDYTYRVAGCVGEFWTKMCVTHVFARMHLPELAAPEYLALGVRFGKGLQLVNILRDLPADLRKGRCYLPKDKLVELGVPPADLLLPANESKFRPLYDRYLDQAHSHLAVGWEYTNRIPFRCLRLRLACAWPVLIGIRTLRRLRGQNVLDPTQRIKITRAEVRRILLKSVLTYPLPFFWRRQFG